MEATIRRARPADAAALVVLRAAMFAAMGPIDEAPGWRDGAERWFREALGKEGPVLIVVADLPGDGPVSSAMAQLERRPPSPGNPTGRLAHVSQVSTLPAFRRRGYARACLAAVLEILDARGVVRADLNATGDGKALYESLGFVPAPNPALRRQAAQR